MKYKRLKWELLDIGEGHKVGRLTLSNPTRMNAIGPRMGLELDAVADEIKSSGARAVIVAGEGGNFCAGGDLKVETLCLERPEDRLGLDENEYSDLLLWQLNDHFHAVLQSAYKKFELLEMPLVAAIDGNCLGIGFELTLACDIRIVTGRAQFAEIAVPAGFLSEWSATRTLAQLIGLSRATELILTGRIIDAREAHEIGLVHRIVEDAAQLSDEAMTYASQLAALPLLGIRHAKRLIKHYQYVNRTEAGFDQELSAILEITRSGDSIEGVRAFNEKRPPRWREAASRLSE